jgi:DNA-binding response OmpR family regulator
MEVITKTHSTTFSQGSAVMEREDDIYDDGFLRVEHKNYYVAVGGSPLKLPRTEFLIFSRLARTPNRIVTADDLWGSVWGGNKPLNTSIACARSSLLSDCKSKRWSMSATG